MLVNEVERQQWMAQMIKNSEEQDYVESFVELVNVVDRKFSEFDIEAKRRRGETRL